MFLPLTIFLCLTCLISGANAYQRLKFRHWFPQYEAHWIGQAAFCQEQLNAYRTNNRTIHPSPCASAADCLLSNATGTINSNFQSASIVLGLVPGILMLIGPTVAEVAVLSTYRPLLAILLAIGTPATFVTTLFQQVNVEEPFSRSTTRLLERWSIWMSKRDPAARAMLLAFYHAMALLAIANNARNSVHLDLRTICGWRCGALFLPLGWSLSGILVHAPGMLAIRLPLNIAGKASISSPIKSTAFEKARLGARSTASDLLFWIATFFAFIQLIFGILDLASLVFISTLEAVNVFLLYAASTMSCQGILLLELADMRRELREHALQINSTQNEKGVRKRAHTL